MRRESGLTLVELMVVVTGALLLLSFAAAYTVPTLARQSMRGAVFDVQSCLQMARIEAVSRNDECSCVIDPTARTLTVFVTKGTAGVGDDELLHLRELPAMVIFARPDSGPNVTLDPFNGGRYHSAYSSDGVLSAGDGNVHLFGGDRFGRVSVFGAGATQVSRWNGTEWAKGS